MKKWILIVCGAIAGLLVIALAGGYLWLQHLLKNGLPVTSGEVVLAGLQAPVEIVRDEYGVPHILARNEADLFFAMGYAMAQDRFWQMEFHRRLGAGRLSELFGEDFVKVDRYFRMTTAAGIQREVPPELAYVPKAFSEGVNAYLKTHGDHLPVEFKLLRYTPEPWDKDDYITILKVINWALSLGWHVDQTAGAMLEKVGEDRLRDAFPPWASDAPLILPGGAMAAFACTDERLALARQIEGLISFSGAGASNNWVVSGRNSATGKPILANDPHLALTNPSFWWEVHLSCPGLDASGFAVPGVPGLPVGHNAHVAWGVTNVMADDVDFYVEKIHPNDPLKYEYQGVWQGMRVKEETIRVKGKDPVKIRMLLTRHGPLVSEPKAGEGKAVSARWAFTERPQPLRAAYLLMKARDVNEVREALRDWELPGQNFVFADVAGNIGYWCCAAIPIRAKGDGLLPVPGWTDEWEWRGYVPFDEKPHVINPPAGFLATANGRVADENYPYSIGRYWEPEDRITRIREVLSAKERLSVRDFQDLQQDIRCLLASEMTPLLVRALRSRSSDEKSMRAADILSGWDFRMSKESPAAALFELTYRRFLDHVFRDELGEALHGAYLKAVAFPPRAVRAILKKGTSPWLDDVTTPEKEGLEEMLLKSLDQAFSELGIVKAEDPAKCRWGQLHQLTFVHALGKKKPLDRIFNLGPYPVDGNNLTVNKKQYLLEEAFKCSYGVSERMIVDLSDMDRAFHVLPTGQSGHLKSPHHQDQVELYLEGRYHTAWRSPADMAAHAKTKMTLRPKP
jgi:penicillin amidase